ncbi:MAG: flavodoxin [Caldilineaceae bacterium]|nr:flavodoxin [Caldilineaceae bacterium]
MTAKIGIFFGSSTGCTERVALMIKEEIEATGVATCDVMVISVENAKLFANYDFLMFGASTWNIGELQDDWGIALPQLTSAGLKGKKVALFGCGDQFGYSNSFADALGIVGDRVTELGAETVGWIVPDANFQFEFSRGSFDGVMMGLPIDEDNQAALTPQRVANWVHWVLEEFGLKTMEEAAAAQ